MESIGLQRSETQDSGSRKSVGKTGFRIRDSGRAFAASGAASSFQFLISTFCLLRGLCGLCGEKLGNNNRTSPQSLVPSTQSPAPSPQ